VHFELEFTNLGEKEKALELLRAETEKMLTVVLYGIENILLGINVTSKEEKSVQEAIRKEMIKYLCNRKSLNFRKINQLLIKGK